ncbi:hypothetical protein DXA68_23875 [Bacteroides stercorirosoris]|uniref:Uncharacterized protein n=1 Tax=Bacteroides stercorirosoris TaxID=871324 RepID=A0A413GKK3_9BACE|nr:hypothetical protein DXA68_23875 [Bacteroides stercorirosoris]
MENILKRSILLFINHLKTTKMFFIKFLVWLFFVIVTMFIGCVPLFAIVLLLPLLKDMENK